MYTKTTRLSINDLLLIGVLSTLITVLDIVICVLPIPFVKFTLISGTAIGALLSAPIYLLLAFKVNKHGIIFMYGLLKAFFYTIIGFPHMFIIIFIGVIAELIMLPNDSYLNIKHTSISWAIFNTGYVINKILLFSLFGEQYFTQNPNTMFTTDNLALMNIYYSQPQICFAISIFTATCAIIGCVISWPMLKNHFIK